MAHGRLNSRGRSQRIPLRGAAERQGSGGPSGLQNRQGVATRLDKAHAALPEGGALIVYEALIDDDRRVNATGLLMSLNMLIETPGGFDFTGADCQGWMRDAGFRETRVEPLAGPDAMVVGIK